MIVITIDGEPRPQQRPRFAMRGSFVQTYKSKRQKEDEETFIGKLGEHEGLFFEKDTPLDVDITFVMPRRKSKSRWAEHTSKPDLDNLVKFVFDCLNGRVWHDDAQVCSIDALKTYGDEPRTEIKISVRNEWLDER